MEHNNTYYDMNENRSKYFKKETKVSPKVITENKENQLRLWRISEKLLGIDSNTFIKRNEK